MKDDDFIAIAPYFIKNGVIEEMITFRKYPTFKGHIDSIGNYGGMPCFVFSDTNNEKIEYRKLN